MRAEGVLTCAGGCECKAQQRISAWREEYTLTEAADIADITTVDPSQYCVLRMCPTTQGEPLKFVSLTVLEVRKPLRLAKAAVAAAQS